MVSSSSKMKNNELRVMLTNSLKSQDEQKGSSIIKRVVYAAISYMACAGKAIEPIMVEKMVMIILLLIACSEPVATMARPLNIPPPPPVLVAKDARGAVPPYGASGCTMIPGRKGRKCDKHW